MAQRTVLFVTSFSTEVPPPPITIFKKWQEIRESARIMFGNVPVSRIFRLLLVCVLQLAGYNSQLRRWFMLTLVSNPAPFRNFGLNNFQGL
jgi:hypothetical protein